MDSTSSSGGALEIVARLGYGARGVVYLLVGGLATLEVVGSRGETTGSRGAVSSLLAAPMGNVLLTVLAICLVCYSIWRCVQSIRDTDNHGFSTKGLVIRASLLISAVSHILLAVFAASLIYTFELSSGGGSGDSASNVAWLMRQPFGQWLVAIVGGCVMGAGVAHLAKAWKTGFDKHFDISAQARRWAYPVCRFGLATRGVVFLIVGCLFIVAAWQVDPNEAGGTKEAFEALRNQAFGVWLFAVVALGLFAFGVYSLLESVYRRVRPLS